MSLIDRRFLNEQIPGCQIRKTETPINVRGIGSTRYSYDEYIVLDIYIGGRVDDSMATAHIRREAHVVDNLKAFAHGRRGVSHRLIL